MTSLMTGPIPSGAKAGSLLYGVGIDIGSTTCSLCILHADKTAAAKALEFPNAKAGYEWVDHKLEQLGCDKTELVIGLEATFPNSPRFLLTLPPPPRWLYSNIILGPRRLSAPG